MPLCPLHATFSWPRTTFSWLLAVVLALLALVAPDWRALDPVPSGTAPEATPAVVRQRVPVAPRVRPAMGLYRSLGAAPRPA